MLIVEYSNGKTVVKIRKDWHPGRISRGHVPRPQNNMQSRDAIAVQDALVRFPYKAKK